jgi:DNA-binding PadR family transcriptional regulator
MKVDLDGLVLGVLADGPLHGYGIVKAIREQSGDLLKVGEGLLYPLLHRLENDALVQAEWQPTREGRPPRKVYALTTKGREGLTTKRKEWSQMRTAVELILRPEGV